MRIKADMEEATEVMNAIEDFRGADFWPYNLYVSYTEKSVLDIWRNAGNRLDKSTREMRDRLRMFLLLGVEFED